MPPADFVHLRVRSAYSLSEGALRLDQLAELCRVYAMPAVAVTDSGNLYGALEFAATVAKAGVQPIVGCTLAIRRQAGDARPAARQPAGPGAERAWLPESAEARQPGGAGESRA